MGRKYFKAPKTAKGKWGLAIGMFLLGIVITGVGIWAYNSYVSAQSTIPPVGEFSIKLIDPLNPSIDLDEGDFDCVLKGLLIGEDSHNIGNWEIVDAVSTVDDISISDLDTEEYERFFIGFNGTVVNDEDNYDDEFGDRVYGYREEEIFLETENVISTYVTPVNGMNMTIINSNTGDIINPLTTNITAGMNFTVMIFLKNMSEGAYDQAYSAYWSFTDDAMKAVAVKSVFSGGTVKAADMFATGLATVKQTTTELDFTTSYLGVTPIVSQFTWGVDAIEAATLYIEAASPPNISLQFAAI